MRAGEIGPCLAVEGSHYREVFEAYVERVLSLALRAGQVLVVDKFTRYKSERAPEQVEARGCYLRYLLPYSPDLNTVEEAFSQIKGSLRWAGIRTREALVEALDAALKVVTAPDARSFFHLGATIPVGPRL